MATIHLLHGYIAAGKTTFALKLERETNAIRFSLDEWMINFYGKNPPSENFASYEENIKNQIWQLTEQLTKRNISCILDFGFWKKHERAEAVRRLEALGATPLFYNIHNDDKTMLSRALKRTNSNDKNSLTIDENAYHQLKMHFEPIEENEDLNVMDVNGNA